MDTDKGLLAPKLPKITVVAAVIKNGDYFLIAQRPEHKHKGGCWEFPGGKVENGESHRQALARELKEEIGIDVGAARPYIKLTHAYPEKIVELDVWVVNSYTGDPVGLEGQPLKWIKIDDANQYPFPEADVAILNAIRLPEIYAITPDPTEAGGVGPFTRSLVELVKKDDIGLVQLRAKSLSKDVLIRLASQCKEIARSHGAEVIINEHFNLVEKCDLAGVHLTTRQVATLSKRPLPDSKWVSASCHSFAEIKLALNLGVDFIVLSPVNKTDSHPGVTPLGWDNAAEMIESADVPVYVLGGVGRSDLPTAWRYGAHGVAGIRSFWPER